MAKAESGVGLHLARAVARRAERSTFAIAQEQPANPQAAAYLNRLSDFLFVLARSLNAGRERDAK